MTTLTRSTLATSLTLSLLSGGCFFLGDSGKHQFIDADDVRLELDLRQGKGGARVLTSDLGYRYVEVNAEYTT